jgi:hypothetical protein
MVYVGRHGPIPNGGHRSLRLASVVQPDRFCTTDVRVSALNNGCRRTHFEGLGASPNDQRRSLEGEVMGKLEVKYLASFRATPTKDA